MAQLEDLVRDVLRAVDAGDFDHVAQALTPDCDFVAPGFSGRGPDAAIGWMRPFLAAFPDIAHELGTLAEGDGVVGFEMRVRGTHTEPLVTPAGAVPATGRALDLAIANVWRVEGGRVAAYHIYFDQTAVLGQLGLIPEPAPAA